MGRLLARSSAANQTALRSDEARSPAPHFARFFFLSAAKKKKKMVWAQEPSAEGQDQTVEAY